MLLGKQEGADKHRTVVADNLSLSTVVHDGPASYSLKSFSGELLAQPAQCHAQSVECLDIYVIHALPSTIM